MNDCIIPNERTDEHGRLLFEEINAEVRARPQAQVVFIGDSLTERWKSIGRQSWDEHFAHSAINLGIDSDETQDVLWRLQHGNLDGLNPHYAILLIGINNIYESNNTAFETYEGIQAIVDLLHRMLPQTQIVVLGLLPFREAKVGQRERARIVNTYLSIHPNITYCDLSEYFVHAGILRSELYEDDGVHLSPRGYTLLARLIHSTIRD